MYMIDRCITFYNDHCRYLPAVRELILKYLPSYNMVYTVYIFTHSVFAVPFKKIEDVGMVFLLVPVETHQFGMYSMNEMVFYFVELLMCLILKRTRNLNAAYRYCSIVQLLYQRNASLTFSVIIPSIKQLFIESIQTAPIVKIIHARY